MPNSQGNEGNQSSPAQGVGIRNNYAIKFESTTASDYANVHNFGVVNAQNFTIAGAVGTGPDGHKKIEPDSTVPFARDDDFIERKEVFEKLDAALSPTKNYRWAALYGLGGIGKSQIAIEYSFRVREAEPNTWVFWVYAGTQETYIQSFRNAAERLQLPGCKNPKADVLRLMESWLVDKSNGPWLCVLDNVDDVDVLHKAFERNDESKTKHDPPLISYIPQKQHGSVLVTSRDGDTAFAAIQDRKLVFKVNEMSVEEAFSLLKHRTSIEDTDEEAAKELLAELEYIPLAISQSGAYIEQLKPQIGIKGYLEEYRSGISNQLALLSRHGQELRRDQTVPNSVITSWEISFREIQRRDSDAANLLALISMLHRRGIPLDLLGADQKSKLRQLITLLEKFSFIKISKAPDDLNDSNGLLLELHRLLQVATKHWLQAHGEHDKWARLALERVAKAFPTFGEYETWKKCELLLPHVEHVLSLESAYVKADAKRWVLVKRFIGSRSDGRTVEMSRAVLLGKLAWYDVAKGRYRLAVERAESSTLILQEQQIKDLEITTFSYRALVEAYFAQCRWEEAESVLLKWLKTLGLKLGDNSVQTPFIMEYLATAYLGQGRLEEAIHLHTQLVKTRKAKLGGDHPDTALSMSSLALAYSHQGRSEEAVQLFAQVLKTKKAKQGEDHLDTAFSMSHLATAYSRQDRFEEAMQLYTQVLNTRKLKLGDNHPSTLATLGNLAQIYSRQGRFEEAEELGAKQVAGSKVTMGNDHPATWSAMHDHACTYFLLRRTDQAIELMEEVVQLRRQNLGKTHEDTINSQQMLDMFPRMDQHRLRIASAIL